VTGTIAAPTTPVAEASPQHDTRLSVTALAIVAALVVIGLGIRIWIMTGQLGAIDSDEAITGLMARHLLDGEFRAFFWRLSYSGTIVTYPIALSFKLFGTSRFALELPYLLMSAGAAVCIWRVGLRFLRPFQAVFAALAFWLWPALAVWIGLKPLIFYVPTLLLGVGVMLCAVRAVERRRNWADWCAAGLLAGLGWWTSPNIVYYVVPTALWLVIWHWRSLWPRAFLSVPFAILGALPWIWNDVNYGFNSLQANYGAQGSYLDHLGYFFTHALPAALGLRAPFTGSWIIGPGHLFFYAIVLGLLALSLWLGLRERSLAAIGLLTLPFLFALVPVASNLESDFIGNGRYFYFFAPFLAFAVARLARPIAVASVLAMALAVSSVWGFARINDFRDAIGGGPPLGRVIATLERGGHHYVFSSFWVSSRLTFESDERIIAVATDLGPSFQGFEDRVRNAKLPVYVTTLDDGPFNPLAGLRDRAKQAGIMLHETRVGDYLIVVPSKKMLAPPAFDLSTRP
jgi:4-amino-4-deoxy-L-arabinose transferase-like glycosyltransferase